MTPEQIALPARAVSTEAGDRLLAMQSHRDRATVEWLTNDIRAIEQEEFDRTMSAVRAHIDTLTAAVEPCPWCGHPPMCHKGPEGECVGENR